VHTATAPILEGPIVEPLTCPTAPPLTTPRPLGLMRRDHILGPTVHHGIAVEAWVEGRRPARVLTAPFIWQVTVGDSTSGGPADTEGAARRAAGRALGRLAREALANASA